jgi:alpha-mannosidase
MEEKYPDLFREMQQRVKEGRWEIVGGMWVEPDLNMPGGRIAGAPGPARQALFPAEIRRGREDRLEPRFVRLQLAASADLQEVRHGLLRHAEDYWNDTTKFPHKLFWWEAPDGSRVLTYFPHDYANGLDPPTWPKNLAALYGALAAGSPR